MQNRIDRLEGLVLSLMTNGNQSAGPAAALAAISADSSAGGSTGLSNEIDIDEDGEGGPEESDTEQVTKSFGVMKMDNNKSYYISEAHWASVLNDVSFHNSWTVKIAINHSNRFQRCEISSLHIRSSSRSRPRKSRQRALKPMYQGQRFYLA
jgi:hypothetical protein